MINNGLILYRSTMFRDPPHPYFKDAQKYTVRYHSFLARPHGTKRRRILCCIYRVRPLLRVNVQKHQGIYISNCQQN